MSITHRLFTVRTFATAGASCVADTLLLTRTKSKAGGVGRGEKLTEAGQLGAQCVHENLRTVTSEPPPACPETSTRGRMGRNRARGLIVTYSLAKANQAVLLSARWTEIGRPVTVSKGSPFFDAVTRSDRKLSASARVLNGTLNSSLLTYHRTL